jgi:hypothetical protein
LLSGNFPIAFWKLSDCFLETFRLLSGNFPIAFWILSWAKSAGSGNDPFA